MIMRTYFRLQQRYLLSLTLLPPGGVLGWISPCAFESSQHVTRLASTTSPLEPSDPSVKFGRKDYWDNAYRSGELDDSSASGFSEDVTTFSWYCSSWSDLDPFFSELVARDAEILVPGVGNDKAIQGMFDAGFHNLYAFDYAAEGVECARKMFGSERIKKIDLRVADARDLEGYKDDMFDAVFEKGTLDSIYLSGGKDKDLAKQHLSMAVSELSRVLKKGGIVFSVTAACASAVHESFADGEGLLWKQVRDGEVYITEDGYSSTNIDASMFAWERL